MSFDSLPEIDNPWFSYAQVGYTKFIKQFLDFYSGRYLEKSSSNLENCIGLTAMHIACMAGRLNVVQLLVEKEVMLYTHKDVPIELLPAPCDDSPPVRTILYKGASPLAIAVARGHHAIVKFLLSHAATDKPLLDIMTRSFTTKDSADILNATLGQNKAILGSLLAINEVYDDLNEHE